MFGLITLLLTLSEYTCAQSWQSKRWTMSLARVLCLWCWVGASLYLLEHRFLFKSLVFHALIYNLIHVQYFFFDCHFRAIYKKKILWVRAKFLIKTTQDPWDFSSYWGFIYNGFISSPTPYTWHLYISLSKMHLDPCHIWGGSIFENIWQLPAVNFRQRASS